MITDKNHSLPCPAYDHVKSGMCELESKIVSERKRHVFKCPEHGRFIIDENGNLLD